MSKADPIDRFEFPDVPACGTAIRFHRGDDWVLDGYRPADGDFATQLVWLEKSTGEIRITGLSFSVHELTG